MERAIFKRCRARITISGFVLVLVLTLWSFPAGAQEQIESRWYSYPTANVDTYGVYHFRKKISLDVIPDSLMVMVSADNRYNLFINGSRVCYGPAKGDLMTYKYDVVNIAPYLWKGDNVLAALVYNGGADKPLAFISAQTAFLLEPMDKDYVQAFDRFSWKTLKNEAYAPISYYEMIHKNKWYYGFYACGPGDDVDATEYPWGWEDTDFDDSSWVDAERLEFEKRPPWNLVQRTIPFMADNHVKPESIRLAENVLGWENFVKGGSKIVVAPNTTAKVILDYGVLTMGYPELKVSGGKGARIQVRYAEALYDKVNLKAHRDSVNGKTMFGVWDVFRPDGGVDRTFRPLWKRSFRYVQFEITTEDESLEIKKYDTEYSGYPYTRTATFESDNPKLDLIFDMGLRTLEMCSGETYYDTPFYEQLSYGGDNRPIGNLSFYTTTDDRLFKEVMRLYSQSVNPDTRLMKSAYPSRFDFDQGTWSLAWIQSLHDYYFLRGDADFVRAFFDKIEGILNFYNRHINEETKILGTLNTKNFMDWSITKGYIPRTDAEGNVVNSTMLSLFYLHTLDCTVRLYDELGKPQDAQKWRERAELLRKGIRSTSWDAEKKFFADSPTSDSFSQHTNILAILCDIIPPEHQADLLARLIDYGEFDEYVSSFFSFFLFKAMEKTGQQHLFLENLDFWYQFLETGHTTTGETGFASHDRSDCHAWSAHPSYFLLKMVCGIGPADKAFDTVAIKPNLNGLNEIKASMPHPRGIIKVHYQKKGNTLQVNILLPDTLKGQFEWQERTRELNGGQNDFSIRLGLD